ncbi:MAG: DnaJ C-terminal domain-containing protein [Pirellulales bacterium]
MAEDYYKILGVRRNASSDEIQRAYRDLARQYHPDLNPDDKTAKKKFQEVQAAFDVLNDAKKREAYDRYGSGFESNAASGPQGGGGAWNQAESFDFGDLFGDRFGAEGQGGFTDIFKQFRRGSAGPQTPRGPAKGSDVLYELEVPFATAVSGGRAEISLRRASGKIEKIQVKVPAGIEDGKRIRLRGQGEKGRGGGPAGDILIRIRVAPHPCFRRRGPHLEVRVPVTFAEAALGAKVDVPSPRGTISLRVPPGTSSGTKLRIKGQGVATNGKAGDLYAEIMIMLPGSLDAEDRQLLQQIAAKHPQNPRADLKW